MALGVARYLKENGEEPLGGQIQIVPNYQIQMDHWTEEYKAELAEKSQDPTQHLAFPAKALRDVSFLLGYVQDPLQFMGPHYARTIDIIKQVSEEDRAYMSEVAHPVYVVMAEGDNILNNTEIKRFYDVVKTPEGRFPNVC